MEAVAKQVGLTPEQLEIRKGGVTGSEIAAVAGLSPYAGPHDIWQRKLGLAPEPEQNFNMERGTYLEGGLRDWLAHRTGLDIERAGTCVHPTYDFVIATPDGIAYKPGRRNGNRLAAVEIKSPNWRTAHQWDDPQVRPDGIPVHHVPQVIWEMAVLEVDRAIVAALISGDLQVYEVPFNEQLFKILKTRAEEFMELVRSEEPPPIDGSDSAAAYLKETFPAHSEELEVLTSTTEIEESIHRLRDIRQAQDVLESERQLRENEIKAFIGDAPGVKGPWGRISWKAGKDREDYNKKAMIAWFADNRPDVLEQFKTTRPGPRTFRPTWAK